MTDERTPHLDAPLPHEQHDLEADLPRLREQAMIFDTAIQQDRDRAAGIEADLASEAADRVGGDAGLAAAITAEITAREEAVSAVTEDLADHGADQHAHPSMIHRLTDTSTSVAYRLSLEAGILFLTEEAS